MIDERLVDLAREKAYDLRVENPEVAELLERLARFAEESHSTIVEFEDFYDSGPDVLAAVEDAVEKLNDALEEARSLVA